MAALPEPVESGNDLVVVDVRGVDKRFTLRHTRSIKEYLVWTLRGRTGELSETFLALNDLSFQVHQGESIGLLGFNGSGKSTTLKMLSGVMRPDHGEVLIRGRIAGLIEVGAGFHPDLTGRENIYLNGAILGMEAIAAFPWRFEFGGYVPADVPLTMYGVEHGASTYYSQVDPVSKRVTSYALITIVEKATAPDRGIAYRMLTKKILCKLTESKKHGHAKQKRAGHR